MKKKIHRRQFLAKMTMTAVGSVAYFAKVSLAAPVLRSNTTTKDAKAEKLPRVLSADTPDQAVVHVVHGTDINRILAAGIAALGGWQTLVKPKQNVVVKPNAAWASLPEQGGNTSPDLVEQCIRECLSAGASEVVVPENPCSPAKRAFSKSGIEEAVKRAGGRMYCPRKPDEFRSIKIPEGKSLKQADVVCDVLDCACLINMPVAKTHGSAVLTLSMKNWMGSVKDRGVLHRTDLHQCIADLSTFIKPTLIILDAIRIMTAGGPRGPGKLAYPNQLVFGTDPVAVDAYSTTLFGKQPFDVPHIKLAHEMGVGCGDLTRIRVEHIRT